MGIISRLFFAHKTRRGNEYLKQYVDDIKIKARACVDNQIGYIDFDELKSKALFRVKSLSSKEDAIIEINKNMKGISELLEIGQSTYILFSEFMKEEHIASALLQPFGVANEAMMNIAFILVSDDKKLHHFIEEHSKEVKPKEKRPISYWIESIENVPLKEILRDYRYIRNLAAHTYQSISIEAAHSFILRTYENIQRLELVINP